VLEIIQEYSSGGKGEKLLLGRISLNLSEFVGLGADGEDGVEEEGVTRRYLLKDSKINSTLKVGTPLSL
jgi:N-terminal C2 in EEIG1 and EHBP1 proteins